MTDTTDPHLTIGAFARASRLSLKALRLYDELHLLPPAPTTSPGTAITPRTSSTGRN